VFIGVVLSYLYGTSENNYFEANRKKSLLDCEQLPLHCLIREGDEVGVNAYIQSKAKLELNDGWGQSALLWAIRNYVDILCLLESEVKTLLLGRLMMARRLCPRHQLTNLYLTN
jgi:hypothetical protein